MNTQLLCLFTIKEELDKSIDFILKNYNLINPNVFILESKIKSDELFITFNVEKGSAAINSNWKTILVHRKKQSNTIYTINALNEVVKSKTGGQLDNSYMIDWEEFQNCILTTSNMGYKKIPTKVYKTINLNKESNLDTF
ncbi:MAG: hypothetical protein ACO25K_07725 [Candidatus Fonsibacter ubiquis]